MRNQSLVYTFTSEPRLGAEDEQLDQENVRDLWQSKKYNLSVPNWLPNSCPLLFFVSKCWAGAVDPVQGQIRQEITISPASLLFGRRRKAAEEWGCCLFPSLICFLLASKTTQSMVVYYYYHCYFPECCKTRG